MLLLQVGEKPLRRRDDTDLLTRRGIKRVHVQSESDALEQLADAPYDLVLLDIDLPNSIGALLVTSIRRAKPRLPVFAFTSRTDLRFKVKVFDLGADDVITAICPIDELLARIRAVLRRIEGYPTSGLSFGPLEVLTDIREIQANGVYLRFTPTEYKFIELLVRKRGALVSKEACLGYMYMSGGEPDATALDVLASRVRKKFSNAGINRSVLKNVWGQGYRLEVDPPAASSDDRTLRPYDRLLSIARGSEASSGNGMST
jgi:DNA-binding response OmpR family regulator